MWANDLAKEFRKRNNENKIGTVLGVVLSVNPIKIGILNNKVFLDNSNCYIAKDLKDRTETVTIDGVSKGITFKGASVGDSVIVITSEDNQTFYAIEVI